MQDAGEDFATLVWGFVGDHPVMGDGSGTATRSSTADAVSTALKQRGFRFAGPTIVHAWFQATGVINDHEMTCFRSRATVLDRA